MDPQIPERRHPIRLQSLPWAYPTMLAPLEGVSHPTFRAMIGELGGVGIVCTEFVRIGTASLPSGGLAKHVVHAPGLPLSVQVMGTHIEHMAEAARLVAEAGADVVDINLGCPAPRVVRKGAGAAMLKDPELLHTVLSAMRAEVPGIFSAKIRAGFDDRASVVHIAQTVEAAGVDFIVVHPRRRVDFYDGIADWRTIALLKRSLRIPVVGNGDCWYAADVARMHRETGCDAVMLGRPALRNPWIFRQAAELAAGQSPFRPDGQDLLGWIELICHRFTEAFPEHRRGIIGKVKEMLTWLGRAVRDDGDYRTTALRLGTIEEILAFSRDRLRTLSPGELDLDAAPVAPLERSGSADDAVHDALPVTEGRWRGGGRSSAPVAEEGQA